MVFTDTVRFLAPDKIPIIHLAFDALYEKLATLSQCNQIQFWKVVDLYKWEYTLRENVQMCEKYINDASTYKPVCTIKDAFLDGTLNVIKFSTLKHIIVNKQFEKKNTPKKVDVQVKSKLNTEKKVKVFHIQPLESDAMLKNQIIDDFILTTGSDHGIVHFFKNVCIDGKKWSKFYEFRIGSFSPIVDLAWSSEDNFLALATLSLEVKVYKLDFKEDPHHCLVRIINSQIGQIHQVFWNPFDEELLTVFEKGYIGIWNIKNESRIAEHRIKEESDQGKKVIKEIQESPSDVEMLSFLDEDLMDYAYCFKLQTSWIRRINKIPVWNCEPAIKTSKGNTSVQKFRKKPSPAQSFLILPIDDLMCFIVSPGLYKNKENSFSVGICNTHQNIQLVKIDEQGSITTILSFENINKTFIEFMWIDKYRFLAIDEFGRVHMFCFEDTDLDNTL